MMLVTVGVAIICGLFGGAVGAWLMFHQLVNVMVEVFGERK